MRGLVGGDTSQTGITLCLVGVSNTGVVAPSTARQPPSSSSSYSASSSSSSSSKRILKTGMIAKKPVVEMKGVRDDIDEEDSEESYYR